MKGTKKTGWLVRHQGAEGPSTADAMVKYSTRTKHVSTADATEDLIIYHLRQQFMPRITTTNKVTSVTIPSKVIHRRHRGTPTIDYREYPTEQLETLRHYSELWSLPTRYEEVFPVRGGPICIPRCAPFDDGLFLISHVNAGDVLCPVYGINNPIHRIHDGKYRSPYLVQDDRFQTVIDLADYRCG
jgi:hypothetical protein